MMLDARRRARRIRALKAVVFCAALVPALWLVVAAFTSRLGANPIDTITKTTGDWTLRFLVATLAVTPLRRLAGWNDAIRFRRMLGLFAFFYGCLHFSTYVVLDHFFDLQRISADLAKRPFITAGFTAFVLMIPLALTSTAASIRRLGGRRWQLLHRLVYVSAIAGVVHYLWLVKADTTRPLRYATVIAVLFAVRAWYAVGRRVRLRPGRLGEAPLP